MNLGIILSVILMVNLVCSSPTDNKQQQVIDTEEFELSYGCTLRYDLGYFGDEESAKIIKESICNVFTDFVLKTVNL